VIPLRTYRKDVGTWTVSLGKTMRNGIFYPVKEANPIAFNMVNTYEISEDMRVVIWAIVSTTKRIGR
jgi:GH24 family phage-related lysozyme (muramidase)